MNILIVNPFGIGDCLFATPLIHTIKEAFPEAKLGFLCNKRTAPLLRNNPFIDRIFIYERDDFKRLQSVSWFSWFKEFNSFIRQIRNGRFLLAIDLSLAANFGFFLWLAGIKRRIGYNYKNRGWLLTDSIKLEGYEGRHIVEYYNALLSLIKVGPKYKKPELYLDKDDQAFADKIFQVNNIDKARPVIAIAPGGGASWGKEAYLKYWPAESYKALIHKILDKYKATVIILGDLSDKELFFVPHKPEGNGAASNSRSHKPEGDACLPARQGAASNSRSHIIDLRGQISLGQSAALIHKAGLFIGNDGGLLHMAAGLNKKTVSFFGPVNPQVYGPYPPDEKQHVVLRRDIECSPCYQKFRLNPCLRNRECLEKIDVEEVLKAMETLLR